jgi:hypothetical protein
MLLFANALQDFVTGPPDGGNVVTHGTFGVENVTGPGHVSAHADVQMFKVIQAKVVTCCRRMRQSLLKYSVAYELQSAMFCVNLVIYCSLTLAASCCYCTVLLQFVATGAWKGSSENHNGDVNCLDSWTGLPVKIPVAGLAPFPSDATSQEYWAEQIVATPITMATLGQGSATANITELQAKYDAAYENMGVKVAGQFTQGTINSGMRSSISMSVCVCYAARKPCCVLQHCTCGCLSAVACMVLCQHALM